MGTVFPCSAPRRRVGDALRRPARLMPVLCIVVGLASAPLDAGILFAGSTTVPPSVQQFAWRVIETRCNYQPYEREQRSFWAYHTQAARVGAHVVYSINILSDLAWKKTEPPAAIEMTIVDDGHLRLTALKSSFVVCASDLGLIPATPTM